MNHPWPCESPQASQRENGFQVSAVPGDRALPVRIEHGDERPLTTPLVRGRRRAKAAEQLLPLVYDELRKLAARGWPGEARPDAAGHGPGPRGVPAAGRRRREARHGTAAATSSPRPPRPCAGSSSSTPGGRRPSKHGGGLRASTSTDVEPAAEPPPGRPARPRRGPEPARPRRPGGGPARQAPRTSPACPSTRPREALGISRSDRLPALGLRPGLAACADSETAAPETLLRIFSIGRETYRGRFSHCE